MKKIFILICLVIICSCQMLKSDGGGNYSYNPVANKMCVCNHMKRDAIKSVFINSHKCNCCYINYINKSSGWVKNETCIASYFE